MEHVIFDVSGKSIQLLDTAEVRCFDEQFRLAFTFEAREALLLFRLLNKHKRLLGQLGKAP